MRRTLVFTAWLLTAYQALWHALRDVRLDVTRDTWVSAVGSEADGNNGGRRGSSSKACRRCR